MESDHAIHNCPHVHVDGVMKKEFWFDVHACHRSWPEILAQAQHHQRIASESSELPDTVSKSKSKEYKLSDKNDVIADIMEG